LSNRANVLHILLVEDNTADVMLVREALRSCPIAADVIIAYDGEQALKFLEKLNFRPDFVLLDLNIPKFDGYVVLDRYHQQGGPPVIVLTASDREADKQRAMALGARDYVVKPRGLYEFIGAVHSIVERWESEVSAQAAEG
jgi:chemotaxis family two-component system response regulator Rcp1